MNIKYRGEEYTLIREDSATTYVYLTFAKRNEYGVALYTLDYRYIGCDIGKVRTNWMYLPYMTIQDLLNIEKDHSRQVAL